MGKQRTKTRVHSREQVSRQQQRQFDLAPTGPEYAPPPFVMEEDSEAGILEIADFLEDHHGDQYRNDEEEPKEVELFDELGNPMVTGMENNYSTGNVQPDNFAQTPVDERMKGDSYDSAVDFEAIEESGLENLGEDGFSTQPEENDAPDPGAEKSRCQSHSPCRRPDRPRRRF